MRTKGEASPQKKEKVTQVVKPNLIEKNKLQDS